MRHQLVTFITNMADLYFKKDMETISFEDFKKLDLRVGTIKSAGPVEGADKLLKLMVDIGGEDRQIVAGIAQSHQPSSLIGAQIVVVTNLEPRTLRGVESRGMLLAAVGPNDTPVLLRPEKETPPGSEIR